MTIPLSPPRRYTTSRQLIGGDDFNNLSDHNFSFQVLTPTGATQAAAAPINAANVEVPAGAAAGGIVLPVSFPGQEVSIINNSGNSATVYPNGTDQLQNNNTTYAAASAGIAQVTLTTWIYICIKKGFWQRTQLLGV